MAVSRALRVYGWQLVVLAVGALAPVLLTALRTPVPADAAAVKGLTRVAAELIALAVFGQLLLVAPAASYLRSEQGQRRAFVAAAGQLARAVIPMLLVLATVAIGGLALVLPGIALFVLLALTAASPELGEPLPAPLLDSIAVVRARLPAVAITLVIAIALDIAIVVVAQRVFARPFGKAPTVQELASYRTVLRVAAVALVAIAPLPACALAAIRIRA